MIPYTIAEARAVTLEHPMAPHHAALIMWLCDEVEKLRVTEQDGVLFGRIQVDLAKTNDRDFLPALDAELSAVKDKFVAAYKKYMEDGECSG